MANVMMFTVDASQIIAKMHFAALQATRGDVDKATKGGGFIVNTGIVKDNPNGVPEQLGKTRFNLDNSSGKYYVGIVSNIGFYQSFALENAITDIFKLRAELYGADKSLLDKNEKDAEEMTKRFDEVAQTIKDALADAGEDVPEDDEFRDESTLVKIRDTIKKIIDTNKDNIVSTYSKAVDDKKVECIPVLQKYMNVFAGSDNVKTITSKNVLAMQVSSNISSPNDKMLVKDFSIQAIPQGEKDALAASFKEKALKNPDDGSRKDNCVVKMCFYVEYSLSIGDKQ